MNTLCYIIWILSRFTINLNKTITKLTNQYEHYYIVYPWMSHAVSKAVWESDEDVIILDVVSFPDARETDNTSTFGSQIFELTQANCAYDEWVEFNPWT